MDSLWAVRRCYDDPDARPSADDPVYLEGLPALLDLFAAAGVTASFFAIGRDAALPPLAALLARAAAAGHEIENHSWSHDLGLGALAEPELAAEIDRAHDAIAAAVGTPPRGFRAPGYDATGRLARLLAARGYAYDASVFPSWCGPLLRLADARLRRARPKARQYGSVGGWRAPLTPYRIEATDHASPYCRAPRADGGHVAKLWELPVLTEPRWRLPVHAGFLLLRGLAPLRRALARLAHVAEPVVFLLHGIDATEARGARHPVPGGRGRRYFEATREAKREALAAMLAELVAWRRAIATRPWLEAADGADKSSPAKAPGSPGARDPS